MTRALDGHFIADLQHGLLAPLRERVIRDKTLCLELRGSYINIYYRGGSLLKASQTNNGYSAIFDPAYFEGAPPLALPAQLRRPEDVEAWLTALPTLKQAIDLKQPGEEREAQQLLVRDNNFGAVSRTSDYYICDIEYNTSHGRFDLIGLRWPSAPSTRKRQDNHRLVLGEVKFGDAALDGAAGLHAHIHDVNAHLAAPNNLTEIKQDMVRVFNQKRALGLLDCGKDLVAFSDEPPLLLLVLINHNPNTAKLRALLTTLPPSPHAELRVATSCLFGYGLYDPAILTVDEALARFDACI